MSPVPIGILARGGKVRTEGPPGFGACSGSTFDPENAVLQPITTPLSHSRFDCPSGVVLICCRSRPIAHARLELRSSEVAAAGAALLL